MRNADNTVARKHEGKRSLGRPRCKLQDDIKRDPKRNGM